MIDSNIAWCHNAWNFLVGCSAERCQLGALEFCYPKTLVTAYGGDFSAVRRTSVAKWQEPWEWEAEAAAMNRAFLIFCGSLMDFMVNLYRDGNDSVGAHSDAELEYGRIPVIASLSLGAARLFRMRQINGDGRWEITLRHGDLLVMAGETQHNWRHEIPKDSTCNQPRINLTFRRIIRVAG